MPQMVHSEGAQRHILAETQGGVYFEYPAAAADFWLYFLW